MGPGSRKSSASSNSSITSRKMAEIRLGTTATPTPHPEATTSVPPIVASTLSSVPSPFTRTSVVAAPPRTQRRVRGPTLGKRVRRLIDGKNGTTLPVYVTQEMRTFCGQNATTVANELGSQIRRMCLPTANSFSHTWSEIPSGLKIAIIQVVRQGFCLDFCLPMAIITLVVEYHLQCHFVDHADDKPNGKTRMVAKRDEASQLGCPLTNEELSRICLGEVTYYVRGFGVGPRPSSFSSQSSFNSARQELQKVQSEMELLREERRREREEYESRWEEERNRRDEEQRQQEEQERQRNEELRLRDEELRQRDEQSQREFDELKAMMMRQMHGRDNV
ncbi:hypothetical protein RHSIM_Rhsim06G0048900 [Rhododendron simsii]|uniref:Uncharacterized protein n=1 Tax=Rhododendron simsii TaxID=118357 RepID=A0A834GQG8_RHOSS|nr:hypothetical protein RHSIM_Rhsim06G0048900 [Rhododendron simsii]